MRVSTMNNLFFNFQEGKEAYLESTIKTNEAGFKVMDFCMCPMQRNETELNGENWKYLVDRIANEAAKRGIEFSQSHLPYSKWKGDDATLEGCEQNEWFIETTKRCIEISGMLGVKWAVVHPVTERKYVTDPEKNLAYNHEIFDKYVEQASKLGVGLAFENMADIEGNRRYGATANDLCAIVDSYNSEYVGACWDFGHANRVKLNQALQLEMLGKRLKATHVDDNIGQTDLHTIPMFGTVNWAEAVGALKKIGYEGDFNFELSIFKKLPEHLRMSCGKFVYEVGAYLVDTYGN
jgi:sugar phosphate isomerase/epimerase